MTDEELLVVVKAATEGKAIQYRDRTWHDDASWVDKILGGWDTDVYRYRVKPEPREQWEGWVIRHRGHRSRVFGDEVLAREYAAENYLSPDCIIHVREVLEENE